MRTVVNTLGDISTVKYYDARGESLEWELTYSTLSDAEASSLQAFFVATEGSLTSFTFLDPMANLLAWSDDLSNQAWTAGPFLSLIGGSADPAGGTLAWRLTNGGNGPQSVTQGLNAAGEYLYCLSVYARSDQPSTATLLLGDKRSDCAVLPDWRRLVTTGTGDAGTSSVTFGVDLAASASVELYGIQVEPQASASSYKPSTRGGVYENAYFRDDVLSITASDVGLNSVTVTIAHAVGL